MARQGASQKTTLVDMASQASPLVAYRNRRPDARETEQLTTRVRYVTFNNEAPPPQKHKLKQCSFCWACWVLQGELRWQTRAGVDLDPYMASVQSLLRDVQPDAAAPHAAHLKKEGEHATGGTELTFEKLVQLIEWRRAGFLSDQELQIAKRALV